MIKCYTYITLISFLLTAFLAGCSQQLDDENDGSLQDDQRIAVCAGIGNPSITTRLTDYVYTTPSDDHPLDAQVWFSDDASIFANTGSATSLPRHSEILFKSGGMTFPVSDVLPYVDAGATYAVGLWPNTDGWTPNSDCTQVSHAIDGTEDLMFAPKITAESGTHFNTGTPLTFGHLLTWLKFRVTALNNDAIVAWGKIKSITVAGKTSVTITLNDGSIAYDTPGTISVYSDATGTALTTNSQELGSVFCAPTDDATYTITITSENEMAGKVVTVHLLNMNNESISSNIDATRGKEFVITLTFQPFNMIDAIGKSLAGWEDENNQITGSVN